MRSLRAASSQRRDPRCGFAEFEDPFALPRSWLAAARSGRCQRAVSYRPSLRLPRLCRASSWTRFQSRPSEALLRGLIPWLPAVMNILSRVEMPPVRDHSGKPSRASCGRVRTDTALDPGRNTIRVRNIFRAEATLISEKHCFYPSGTRNAYDSEWVRDPQRSPFLAAEVLRMALFSHKSDTCRGAVRRLLSRSKKR